MVVSSPRSGERLKQSPSRSEKHLDTLMRDFQPPGRCAQGEFRKEAARQPEPRPAPPRPAPLEPADLYLDFRPALLAVGAMAWSLQLLLLLPVSVILATNVTQYKPNQYELGSRCCDLCPPGYFVSGPCDMKHLKQCSPCPPDTFMPYDNRESECKKCSRCRQDDQEMVSDCDRYRDRRCQCKTGTYCDSEDCTENCNRCTRCKGATLQTCNASMDTVCATDRNPEPGNPASGSAESSSSFVKVGVPIISVICLLIGIGIGIGIRCCRRPGLKALHTLGMLWKKKSSEPSSRSLGTIQLSTLPATDPERGPPAPGEATTPLLQEGDSALAPGAGTRPGPSEEPGEDTELQEVVAGGSQAAPEQELQTAAPPAPGLQAQAEAAASLRHLEQQYKQ
ncbi:tumor necrosis factor receptor superfamily member 14-like [Saccopteryx bilineata]|uniref:tumor necrosis factor receptor superfamily member 14-like n=1 Tax=Saccopteryx bilineata TaxID=59482 RepID=UPI00338F7E75